MLGPGTPPLLNTVWVAVSPGPAHPVSSLRAELVEQAAGAGTAQVSFQQQAPARVPTLTQATFNGLGVKESGPAWPASQAARWQGQAPEPGPAAARCFPASGQSIRQTPDEGYSTKSPARPPQDCQGHQNKGGGRPHSPEEPEDMRQPNEMCCPDRCWSRERTLGRDSGNENKVRTVVNNNITDTGSLIVSETG